MTPTLHKTDEEADVGAYQAYLRAQTDTDLWDIVHHLDPVLYPARLDAARREANRRHVLHLPVYTFAEYGVRYFSVLACALSILTVTLTLLLSEDTASGPAWPTLGMLPDGIPVSHILLLLLVATLRSALTLSVRLGLYPLTLFVLGWWTVSRAGRVRRHQARADVWWLSTGALVLLTAAIVFASGPVSALPDIFTDAPVRGLTLLDPFA